MASMAIENTAISEPAKSNLDAVLRSGPLFAHQAPKDCLEVFFGVETVKTAIIHYFIREERITTYVNRLVT
jgi:hypothetical protein